MIKVISNGFTFTCNTKAKKISRVSWNYNFWNTLVKIWQKIWRWRNQTPSLNLAGTFKSTPAQYPEFLVSLYHQCPWWKIDEGNLCWYLTFQGDSSLLPNLCKIWGWWYVRICNPIKPQEEQRMHETVQSKLQTKLHTLSTSEMAEWGSSTNPI